MRIGIFSDVHGNQYAMNSFCKIVKTLELDEMIYCGDIFGYYYGQGEIICKLCDYNNLLWIRGNHDQLFLDICDNVNEEKDIFNRYGRSYDHVIDRISEEHIAFLRKLPISIEVVRCGLSLLVLHGTPANPLNGRLYPEKELNTAEFEKYDIVIMGHTHFRLHRKINHTTLLNPGSLGQPRDSYPSSFAVLTLPEKTIEFIDVNYDRKPLESQIKRNDPGNAKLIEILYRGG